MNILNIQRQNPDIFFKAIDHERTDNKKGHLKIFFGYAAGVGKTYAMLKAAHSAKMQGTDVVAGYIEPHNRPQTEVRQPESRRKKDLWIS